MKYWFIFAIGLVVGIVAVQMSKRKERAGSPNVEQQKQKQQNLQKVLEMARSRGEISNRDVQSALGVSDASATNYFQELENQGKIEQVGKTGQAVTYRPRS